MSTNNDLYSAGIPCFTKGTLIETPTGQVAIERFEARRSCDNFRSRPATDLLGGQQHLGRRRKRFGKKYHAHKDQTMGFQQYTCLGGFPPSTAFYCALPTKEKRFISVRDIWQRRQPTRLMLGLENGSLTVISCSQSMPHWSATTW